MFLTAKKVGPEAQNLTTPRVVTINPDHVVAVISDITNGGSVVKTKIGTKSLQFDVAETPSQVEVANNPLSTNPYAQDKVTGAAATGGAQGAGLDVTTYLTEVTTATATSADAVDLDVATVGKVRVILNNTAIPLELYPQSGETLDGAAVNIVLALPAFSKAHLYCKVAGAFVLAAE